jgi:hypothetical protein
MLPAIFLDISILWMSNLRSDLHESYFDIGGSSNLRSDSHESYFDIGGSISDIL